MATICLIDDEKKVLEVLENFFTLKGMDVHTFETGEDFLSKFDDQNKTSAFLIDWKLPQISGLELVGKIRKSNPLVPIFMLTGCSDQENIIEGIEAGADDYIVKPFNLKELFARLDNAIKKYENVRSEKEQLKVIEEGNVVTFNGHSTSLTSREFEIFKQLLKHEGSPVAREKLMESFDLDQAMIKRNVDVHVFSLRKKLLTINLSVETVRGVGYKLLR